MFYTFRVSKQAIMRFGLVGLLLSSGMLLAQSNTGSIGRLAVSSVDVTNGSSVSSDHLRAITEEVAKHTYPADQPGEEIAERARYTLQQDGYFKAEVRLANQLVSPTQSTVAVTLEISEGQQYRIEEIAFSRNKVMSAQELRQQFAIGNGEIFDVEKIRRGLEQTSRARWLFQNIGGPFATARRPGHFRSGRRRASARKQ